MILRKRTIADRELEWEEVDQNWADIEQSLSQKAGNNHLHNLDTVSGLSTSLDSKISQIQKGTLNGVATLGPDGKVPAAQLPEMTTVSPGTGISLPHNSLTQEDIGKIIIRKDKLCQLPVFEPAVENVTVKIPYDFSGFQPYQPAEMVISFNDIVTDGTTLSIPLFHRDYRYPQYYNYTFRETPSGSFDVPIEASTVLQKQSFLTVLNNTLPFSELDGYSISDDSNKVMITANLIFGDTSNIFPYTLSGYGIAVSSNMPEYLTGIQNSWIGFLALSTIKLEKNDNTSFFLVELSNLFEYIYEREEYSLELFITLDDTFRIKLPASPAEILNFIVNVFNESEYVEECVDEGGNIKIVFTSDILSVEKRIADSNTNNLYTSFLGEWIYVPKLPTHCKYPIVGILKEVTATECKIEMQPITPLRLTGSGNIDSSVLFGLGQFCVLNPQEPGSLMSLTSVFNEYVLSGDGIFTILASGYVKSLDKEVETGNLFYGLLNNNTNNLFGFHALMAIFNG